jgi:hypothetical protein
MTICALRPTPRGIGSAFKPGAKRHSVDGGSAGSAFSSKGRGPEAKGARVGGYHRGPLELEAIILHRPKTRLTSPIVGNVA